MLDAGYEFLVVRDYTAFRRRDIVSFMNPSDFAPVRNWLATRRQRRIWYIEHQNFYWDPHGRIRGWLAANRTELVGWRQAKASPVDAVTVRLFAPERAAEQ